MRHEAVPAPTEEEAVAIAAAIEALWPRPMTITQPEPLTSLAWRYSGRWWQRQAIASVQRPWR